jgi:type I restriction-modification system DNA methylase subunit
MHRDAYTTGQYNETQLRREFVDPLFSSLGWDMNNSLGYAEAYKDVIHEDAIKVSTDVYTKAPDYCFRIGGVRKFFVEAKRPLVDIARDPAPAFQLRRYAWSAKLPLSVLTDFEEFAVYDTRIKPTKRDAASRARILLISYKDLVDRWEEISSIFSREAILRGSFDKYAETTRDKRGSEEVDDAFLSEIEKWRSALAKTIAIRNEKLSTRDLNHAVQATIDRIVFLRISEDRGTERYGDLLGLTNGTNTYRRLFEVFEKADARYNSGLFHFSPEKNRKGTYDAVSRDLHIDDKVIKDIVRSLYYPDSPYEFSVLPADILGQVYEQFLGKIIRLTPSHRAVVEFKPEVKKAGGVYYTPTYVVEYMVNKALKAYLKNKNPAMVAGAVKGKTPLRLLDLACGSGSFLLVAYQCLLDWHRDWYVSHGPQKYADGKAPVLYQRGASDWRLTTAERKRILLTNIFGVDVDEQAVEVTKLSLLLKVLEGESDQTLQAQLKLFRERALPDIDGNIKSGNSIIGLDYYTSQLDLIAERDDTINAFDWQTEFPDIMAAGGFDIIVGNPPYRRELDYKNLMDEIAVTDFGKTYRSPRMDLWYYFAHRGLSLLKPTGTLSFIVNSYWTSGTGADKLIAALRDSAHISEIFSLGKLSVFKNVAGQHMILSVDAVASSAPTLIRVANPSAGEKSAEPFVRGTKPVTEYRKKPSQVYRSGKIDLQPPADALLRKIEKFPALEKYGEIRQGIAENPSTINSKTNVRHGERWSVGEGVFTLTPAEAKKLRLPKDERKLLRPYHDLSDLGRYWADPSPSRLLIYSTKNTLPDIRSFPTLQGHLKRFMPIMEMRRETQKGSNKWWHLHWPREERIWQSGKVVALQMSSRPSFVAIKGPSYVSFSVNVFVPASTEQASLEYFEALLNSRLMWFWFSHYAKRRGVGLEINGNVLARAPIRKLDWESKADVEAHNSIVLLAGTLSDLVKKELEAGRGHSAKLARQQADAIDDEIDRQVYNLYGLTTAERKAVDTAVMALGAKA